MPAINKHDRRINLKFVANRSASTHGGLPAIEALALQFGLWGKVARLKSLDPRVRKGRGFGPEVIAAQIVYTLCSGGESLADSEELNNEPLVRELSGIERFADQTTVGEWLRGQTAESLAALRQLNRELVQWLMQRAEPGRWLHAGQREFFFDDTQLELYGKSFEGAGINYENKLALSWQTMWMGPFLLDGTLGTPGDVSSALPQMLAANGGFWKNAAAYFYADSGSSSARYLENIEQQSWHWSVSYNRWTQTLERLAAELPENLWGSVNTKTHRDGTVVDEQFTWLKHLPEGAAQAHLFACCRRKTRGEMFWRYSFVACDRGRQGDPRLVFERHSLKGDKEKLFSEVLSGLDLHHPPCAELLANEIFYALASIAYNLLIGLKLLYLPDEQQGWRLKTLLKQIVILPAHIVRHARQIIARVWVPPQWLEWWQALYERIWATA